jgi:hypothetical protein
LPTLFFLFSKSMLQSLYTLLYILLTQIDSMSFHASAVHIELEDDHILKAVLRNEDGDEQESTLDLNDHIGNDNGMLPQSPFVSPTSLPEDKLVETQSSHSFS